MQLVLKTKSLKRILWTLTAVNIKLMGFVVSSHEHIIHIASKYGVAVVRCWHCSNVNWEEMKITVYSRNTQKNILSSPTGIE